MSVRPAPVPLSEEHPTGRIDQDMASFLRHEFPVHSRYWTDDALLDIVTYGRAKSELWGLRTEREIRSYLALLPMLGGRFDEDPMLPWATSVLHDKSIREPAARIERLTARTREYLDATAGKNNEHLRQCADVIRSSWQHLLIRASQADPQTGFVFLMERTFPRKWAKAPLQLLPQFVSAGKQRAHAYEIRSTPGTILYLAFAFLFGWKFDEDPLLPMFTSILRQTAGGAVMKERLLYERLVSLAEIVAREPSAKDRAPE